MAANSISFGSKLLRSEVLWSILRWVAFIVAIIFVGGYVVLRFFLSDFDDAYPRDISKIAAYVHVPPASLILILSPLQLFNWIRERHIRLHRIIGYTIAFLTAISVVGSIFLCFAYPEGGHVVAFTGLIMSLLWAVFLVIGIKRIRDKDVASHREWMIRFFVLGYAIVVMRVVAAILIMGFRWNRHLAVQTAIPGVFFLAAIFAEFYVVNTRSKFTAFKTPTLVINGQSLVDFRNDYVALKLVQKEQTTWNISIFTFELAHPSMRLCIPPGHHMLIKCDVDGKEVIRPYSPIDRGNVGVVEFAVKRYDGGKLSRWLHDAVKIGDRICMKGPAGTYDYLPNKCESVNIIAAGTGITPMLSVITSILSNPFDRAAVNMVYCNNTENDIAFRALLDNFAFQYPERFHVVYVISKPTSTWTFETGRITSNICIEHLYPPDNSPQVLICGPQLMALRSTKIMRDLGHSRYNIHAFGITER
eukprot:TRINITY_DN10858_c0_g1_i1.p1 TRINITY_DN10858_c0_g1~~TRINITY_DN10858_c0_g1_i1.p1  ORF type:complete len:475 (+),score=53.61 TRINITY_DN10858_c0_g1_i1:90-1514(+)